MVPSKENGDISWQRMYQQVSFWRFNLMTRVNNCLTISWAWRSQRVNGLLFWQYRADFNVWKKKNLDPLILVCVTLKSKEMKKHWYNFCLSRMKISINHRVPSSIHNQHPWRYLAWHKNCVLLAKCWFPLGIMQFISNRLLDPAAKKSDENLQ